MEDAYGVHGCPGRSTQARWSASVAVPASRPMLRAKVPTDTCAMEVLARVWPLPHGPANPVIDSFRRSLFGFRYISAGEERERGKRNTG